MRWWVESWDPAYGASAEDPAELGRSSAQVVLDVELDASHWRPIDPDPSAPGWSSVLFVDGVRRIDAMAWIADGAPDGANESQEGPTASLALCASYAAGVVCCCPAGAHLRGAQVRRGLFTGSSGAADVVTAAGTYRRVSAPARPDSSAPGQDLSQAVQARLRELEVDVSASARSEGHGPDGEDLLVVDGPLSGRAHLPRTVGFIKTHRSEYLPAPLHRMAGSLARAQRTPVFGLGTSWQRYSWYLRLPGGSGAPWAGVVRVECSAELPPAQVVELANRGQRTLCRYASEEYKDPRAPQNLYPIAGLERELRRRLGDQALVLRAVRRAAG